MHVNRGDLERLVADAAPSSELSRIRDHLHDCRTCQAELAAKLDQERMTGSAQINSNAAARIKVLDPITSLAPSAPADVLQGSPRSLHVRVSRFIYVGALVHVRSSLGLAVGQVRYCIPVGSEFQIGVKLEPAV